MKIKKIIIDTENKVVSIESYRYSDYVTYVTEFDFDNAETFMRKFIQLAVEEQTVCHNNIDWNDFFKGIENTF